MPLRTRCCAGCCLGMATIFLASCSDQTGPPRPARQVRQPGAERAGTVLEPVENPVPATDGDTAAVAPAVEPPATFDPDDRYREQIIGLWKQFETGVRWLDVRPDGTATMFIDPDWIAQAVIGDGLTVEIEWSIEDGRVLMRSVSGEPESAFKAVTALYGSDRERPIVALDDKNFVMLDETDGEESTWVRVDADEPTPAALRN